MLPLMNGRINEAWEFLNVQIAKASLQHVNKSLKPQTFRIAVIMLHETILYIFISTQQQNTSPLHACPIKT